MVAPDSPRKRIRVSDLFETGGAPRVDEVVSRIDLGSSVHADDEEGAEHKENRGSVLVIRGDDDPYWYRVDRYLSSEEFHVIMRHVEAVEFRKLVKQPFSVVLFDWRRPTKRHRQILTQLKMLRRHVHVVALYGEGLDGVELRRLRVDDAIAMPASEDDLYRAVDDAMKFLYLHRHVKDVFAPTPVKAKAFVALFILYSYLVIDGIMWRGSAEHLLPDALFWVTLIASFPLLPLTLPFVWLYATSTEAAGSGLFVVGWFAFSVLSLWVLASLIALRVRPSLKVGYIMALVVVWMGVAALVLKFAGFY